jgi:hypothetical protein
MKNNQTRTQKAKADYIKFAEKFPRKNCITVADILAIYEEADTKHPWDIIGDALEIGYMYGYRRGLKDGKDAAKGVKA